MNQRNAQPAEKGKSNYERRHSEESLAQIRVEVAGRIRDAFDGAINAEIARRCKVNPTTIKNFMDAERLPTAEILLQMQKATGINLNWLLTGKGSKRVEISNLFGPDEEARIRKLARVSGRTFDEQVRVMTLSAIEFLENASPD